MHPWLNPRQLSQIPQIQSKCRPWQNFNFVTHHRHLVESRLAIKHHKIIVLHVPFNLRKDCSTILMDILRWKQLQKQRSLSLLLRDSRCRRPSEDCYNALKIKMAKPYNMQSNKINYERLNHCQQYCPISYNIWNAQCTIYKKRSFLFLSITQWKSNLPPTLLTFLVGWQEGQPASAITMFLFGWPTGDLA